jgi:hypothetical protein
VIFLIKRLPDHGSLHTEESIMVAGRGLEPLTSGLWALRAAAAPPRDIVISSFATKTI